jgi:hypothetical protein
MRALGTSGTAFRSLAAGATARASLPLLLLRR